MQTPAEPPRANADPAGTPVHFFLETAASLPAIVEIDPDRDWRRLAGGEASWILQTFLRLRAAGHPVRLADRLPPRGLVLFHAKQKRTVATALRRQRVARRRLLLVGVRGDLSEPLIADLEVVQNGTFADDRRRFAVHHWPQPGLRPRDPARGDRIRTVVYKGLRGSLDPAFREPAWEASLRRRGLLWVLDGLDAAGREVPPAERTWNDYAAADVVLAVRPPDPRRWRSKPASKLINAWHAGVPALLGPEVAYRELRRAELDYLEVEAPEAAARALDRLIAEPPLYRAMIDNGRRRAAEVSVAAITERWVELLYDALPRAGRSREVRFWRALPPFLSRAGKAIARTFAGRPAR